MKSKLLWLALFSLAMAFMESAVVVYLREIYYPEGFGFPLKPIEPHIALTEIVRETATLLMLLAIGWLTGRTVTERFGCFLLSFALWDLGYYLFLYVLLGWPETLLTWDILFLIPVTWVGPVLAPVINSLSMIVLALIISYYTSRNLTVKMIRHEWWLLGGGSVVVIISYTEGYIGYIRQQYSWPDLLNPGKSQEIVNYAAGFIPEIFSWWLFIPGQLLIAWAIVNFYLRQRRSISPPV